MNVIPTPYIKSNKISIKFIIITKLIKTFYDVDMIMTDRTLPKEKGSFCLMPFNDVSVEIKNKETV